MTMPTMSHAVLSSDLVLPIICALLAFGVLGYLRLKTTPPSQTGSTATEKTSVLSSSSADNAQEREFGGASCGEDIVQVPGSQVVLIVPLPRTSTRMDACPFRLPPRRGVHR